MKKLFAILLCLALALGCAALAENEEKARLGQVDINGAFMLQCALAEGYTLQIRESDGDHVLAAIVSEDENKPSMSLSVRFDEMYSDVERFNDLDDEAKAQIAATFQAEDEVDISYTETSYGTQLMVVKAMEDGNIGYVDFYSIYRGYQVEMVMNYGMNTEKYVTEDQLQIAVDFLSEMDFVPVDPSADVG